MSVVEDARELAERVHAHQRRKGSERPYVEHLVSVAGIVAAHGGSEALQAAAWLHDAVEDAGLALDEVRARFGPHVADLVDAVTEPAKAAPWEERKRDVLQRLAGADREHALLKAADALANARDTLRDLETEGAQLWARFRRGRAQQLWWHCSVARLVAERLDDDPLALELGRAVDGLCLAALRRAGEDDLESVLDLTERLLDPPAVRPAGYDREAARARARWWIEAPDRVLLLAEPDEGGAPLAYAACAVDIESIRFGRRAWVEDLVTSPGARGRGHGAALLAACRAFGRERGCTHLDLDTARSRSDAQRFYAREGGRQASLVYTWALVG